MSNSTYTSCIKYLGYPLLPPLIDDKLRLELQRDKEAAIAVERDIALRKASEYEKCSDSTDEAINQSLDAEECSEGTVKLIEYIKKALQDVSHEKEVQDLQCQIFEELKKCESLKAASCLAKSTSCETLHILDASTISNDSLPKDVKLDSSDSDQLSPEKPEQDPPRPIRRKSFTLDAPSPAVIKFIQSLSKDKESDSESSSLSKKKSARNLNELWGKDSSYLDFSSYSTPPVTDSGTNELDNSITNHNDSPPNVETSPQTNGNGIESLRCVSSKPYSSLEEKSAAIIQAGVRGYLTRRLLRTMKVIDLKKTIRDSLVCALKLHSEQTVTSADVTFHVRIIRQVTAACYELHSIFFEYSIKEKMALIRQDRILAQKALSRKRSSASDLSRPSSASITSELTPKVDDTNIGARMSASYPTPERPNLEFQTWS